MELLLIPTLCRDDRLFFAALCFFTWNKLCWITMEAESDQLGVTAFLRMAGC